MRCARCLRLINPAMATQDAGLSFGPVCAKRLGLVRSRPAKSKYGNYVRFARWAKKDAAGRT